jgi:hypothetical protein
MAIANEDQKPDFVDINQREQEMVPAISLEEQERLELLIKADTVKGEQLTVGLFGEMHTEQELRDFAVGKNQDPDKMYQVYYMGIDKLLDKFLPKGEAYRE